MIQKESFNDISYLLLWQNFFIIICAIFVEGIMGNIPVKLYLFGPVVQKEMSFK